MNKAVIVRITGFLVIPILVMLVIIYFLYPFLNSEKYQQIVESINPVVSDSSRVDSLVTDSLDFSNMQNFETDQDSLVDIANNDYSNPVIDSLQQVINALNTRIKELEHTQELDEIRAKLEEEAFANRIKSLLNLEEDELAPILEKMTNEQLVRLYTEAGTIQREKILRALNSDRAAKLITEIML